MIFFTDYQYSILSVCMQSKQNSLWAKSLPKQGVCHSKFPTHNWIVRVLSFNVKIFLLQLKNCFRYLSFEVWTETFVILYFEWGFKLYLFSINIDIKNLALLFLLTYFLSLEPNRELSEWNGSKKGSESQEQVNTERRNLTSKKPELKCLKFILPFSYILFLNYLLI